MKGKPEAKSKCDDCPIDVEIRRNTHCCERCTDEHPAYERKLETNALLQSKPTESKRPELTDERFANWCMDTFEDQKDKYLAFSVEQSKWIDVLEARLSVHDAELSKLQEKIDFTEYQYDDLAYWFGKMQKDNEALEGENKKLQKDCGDWEQLYNEAMHEARKVCRENDVLEGRLEAIKEKYEAMKKLRTILWDEYNHLMIPSPQGPILRRWIDWLDAILKQLGVLVSQGQDHVVAKLGVLLNPPKETICDACNGEGVRILGEGETRGDCPQCRGTGVLLQPLCSKTTCKECIEKYGLDKNVLWYCPEDKSPETCGKIDQKTEGDKQ